MNPVAARAIGVTIAYGMMAVAFGLMMTTW